MYLTGHSNPFALNSFSTESSRALREPGILKETLREAIYEFWAKPACAKKQMNEKMKEYLKSLAAIV